MPHEMIAESRQWTVAGKAIRIARRGTVGQELRRVRPRLYNHTLHATPRQLILQDFGERLQCKLACTIGCTTRKQEASNNRRDVDDQSAAL
ncbi:MAG: hypothetical protein JWN34_5526 [Bryobacterales bacterium]|nr:hypothetical protein [Bryobacterales bacterium]